MAIITKYCLALLLTCLYFLGLLVYADEKTEELYINSSCVGENNALENCDSRILKNSGGWPGRLIVLFPECEKKKVERFLGEFPEVKVFINQAYFQPIDAKSENKVYASLEFPPEQEKIWFSVFKDSKLFTHIYADPMQFASLDNEVMFESGAAADEAHKNQRTFKRLPLQNARYSVVERILELFERRFSLSHLAVRKKENYYIEINLHGLRNTVLKNQHYWEKLTLKMVYVPPAKILYLWADGAYASGLGNIEPFSGYHNMENSSFQEQFQTFMDELAQSIREYIGGGIR